MNAAQNSAHATQSERAQVRLALLEAPHTGMSSEQILWKISLLVLNAGARLSAIRSQYSRNH